MMPDEESLSAISLDGDSQTIVADPPLDPNRYSRGYQKLAWLMGQLPEFALLRRFGRLNSLNLLYMQTEIYELEKQLHQVSSALAYSTDQAERRTDFAWAYIVQTDPAGNHTEQYKLILKIREKLKEYSITYLWLLAGI